MISKKTKKDRRFIGGGARPDLKKIKQVEAKERQDHYDSLSVQEKMEHLGRQTTRLGGNAKKQFAKLTAALQAKLEKVAPTESEVDAAIADGLADANKKHLKAKERRAQREEMMKNIRLNYTLKSGMLITSARIEKGRPTARVFITDLSNTARATIDLDSKTLLYCNAAIEFTKDDLSALVELIKKSDVLHKVV